MFPPLTLHASGDMRRFARAAGQTIPTDRGWNHTLLSTGFHRRCWDWGSEIPLPPLFVRGLEQCQQTFKQFHWPRRAAADVQVDRHDAVDAADHGIAAGKDAAVD